jgi:serine/threonine protein kinase
MAWDVQGYKVGEKLGSGAFGEVRLGIEKSGEKRKVSAGEADKKGGTGN